MDEGGQPIWVGDIGGTNARFALARATGGNIQLTDKAVFPVGQYPDISAAATAFLAQTGRKPRVACFAVAGPIGAAATSFTNSPWVFDRASLQRMFGLQELLAVNDFEALAAGVGHLAPEDFEVLKPGHWRSELPRLVVGPGTGFGQALLVPGERGAHVIATEGGHVGFAPANEREMQVLSALMRRHGRVSLERLASGPGLLNIYRALGDAAGVAGPLAAPDAVAEAALAGGDGRAEEALQMFCAILGGAMGDAVLATGAWGGVYVGGGVVPRLRAFLPKSEFLARFQDKGRMRGLLADVPIHLIAKGAAAMIGAAALARARLNLA